MEPTKSENGTATQAPSKNKYADVDNLLDKLDASHPIVEARAKSMNYDVTIRKAQTYASSSVVPAHYSKNVANCAIALEMAERLNVEPLIVMQNLYIVHGTPSWKSSFLIGQINASGHFSTNLRFDVDGDGDDFGCVAWASDKNGERIDGPRVSIAMAKAEGWLNKKGSKWQTMPEVMLRYRAAAFFSRISAPELGLGLYTYEEAQDTAAAAAPKVAVNNITERLKAKAAKAAPRKSAAAKPEEKTDQTQDDLEQSAFVADNKDRPFKELQGLYLEYKPKAKGFDLATACQIQGLPPVKAFSELDGKEGEKIAKVLWNMKQHTGA